MNPIYTQTEASCKLVHNLNSDMLMSGQKTRSSSNREKSKKKSTRKHGPLNRKALEKLVVGNSQPTVSGQAAESSSVVSIPEKRKRGRKPGPLNRKPLKLAVLGDSHSIVSGQTASSIGNIQVKKMRGRKPSCRNKKPLEKLAVLSDTRPTLSGQTTESSSMVNKPEKRKRGRKPGTLNRRPLEKLTALGDRHPIVLGQTAESSSIGNIQVKKMRGRKPSCRNKKPLEKLAVLSDTRPTLSGQTTESSSMVNKPEKRKRGRKPGTLNRRPLEKLTALGDSHPIVSGQTAEISIENTKEKRRRGRNPGPLHRKSLEKLAVPSNTGTMVSGQATESGGIVSIPEKRKRGRKPGTSNRKPLEKLAVLGDTHPTLLGQTSECSSSVNIPEKRKRGRKPGTSNRKPLEKFTAPGDSHPIVSGQTAESSSIENTEEKRKRGRKPGPLNRKLLEKLAEHSNTCATESGQPTESGSGQSSSKLSVLGDAHPNMSVQRAESGSSIGNTQEKTCRGRTPGHLKRMAVEKLAVIRNTQPTVSEQTTESSSIKIILKKKTRGRKPGYLNQKTLEKLVGLTFTRSVSGQEVRSRNTVYKPERKRGQKPGTLNRRSLEKLVALSDSQLSVSGHVTRGSSFERQPEKERRGRRPGILNQQGSTCPNSCVTAKEFPNAVQTTEHTQVGMYVCALASTLNNNQIHIEEQKKQNGIKTCSPQTCHSPGLPNPAVMLQKCDRVLRHLASAKKISEPKSVISVNESTLAPLVFPCDIAERQNTQISALKTNGLETSIHQKRQIQRKRLIRGKTDNGMRPRRVTLRRSGSNFGLRSNKSESSAERNKNHQCNIERTRNDGGFCNGTLQQEVNNNNFLIGDGLQQSTFEEPGLLGLWDSWRTPAYLLSEEEYSDNSLLVMHSPSMSPCSQLPKITVEDVSCQRVEPFNGKTIWKCSCARTSIWTFSQKRPNDNKNTNIDADDQALYFRKENVDEMLSKKRKLDLLLDDVPPIDLNHLIPNLDGFSCSSCSRVIGNDTLDNREEEESTSKPIFQDPNTNIIKNHYNEHISDTSSRTLADQKLSQMTKIIKAPSLKLPSMHQLGAKPSCLISTDTISGGIFVVRDHTVDTVHISENGESNESTALIYGKKVYTSKCVDSSDLDLEFEPSLEKKPTLNNAILEDSNYVAPEALAGAEPDISNVAAPKALDGSAAKVLIGVSPDTSYFAAPDVIDGTVPAASNSTAPEALAGAAPEASDGVSPKVLIGAAPQAVNGTAPEASAGAVPETSSGTAPEACNGSAPKASDNCTLKALDGAASEASDCIAPDALNDAAVIQADTALNTDTLSVATPDVLKAYEDDVLIIDVIPDDPDLFGFFKEECKSSKICCHLKKSCTANQKPKNITLVRKIPQEEVSFEYDSDFSNEINIPEDTSAVNSFLLRQDQNVPGNQPDWTFPEGHESYLNLIEDESKDPPELSDQSTNEVNNETEISSGGENSSLFQDPLHNIHIPGLPQSNVCLKTETVLNEDNLQLMHGYRKDVPILDVASPDSWDNCRQENKLPHKELQQIKLPYGYCKFFFNALYGCCRAQCTYLHVPKESDEKLCMDLLRKMIDENRTSFLQRAFLVFNEYYSKYLPSSHYDEGVFTALLNRLLQLSWWQEVLHLMETASSANILLSMETFIKVFSYISSSCVQGAVPSLMDIFSKCLDAGLTPTLPEINHIIAIVNQFSNSRMPINYLLSVKSKIEAHLPKKSLVHELEAAKMEIEHCKVNSDWVKLGTLYVTICRGRDNITDLKNFSRFIAEALMKESLDERLDVPYCEFADTIFKHPQLEYDDLHRTIVGRIGISIMFFYYRKELWQKGRRILFKLRELRINYKALKGITGQEVFASRCTVINVAVEIFLMCGRLNSAVQTLRECDWIIHNALWPCHQMDVLKRHSLLCTMVQEALSKSMYTMCFEILQNLPGFKESQAEFNVSQYSDLFNRALNSAVLNRSLNISSLIVDFMVLRKIPIDYLNLRELITAFGHSTLWQKARDHYKYALSLGFYSVLDGLGNSSILDIPSFMSAIEMLLTIERFMVSNSRIIQLPGGCTQNLQIILRKIFREEDTSKGKDAYQAAAERLLEASRLSSPRLFTKYLTVNNSGEQVYTLDHNYCVKWLNENLNWAVKIWGFH